jgi:hypothetical protein
MAKPLVFGPSEREHVIVRGDKQLARISFFVPDSEGNTEPLQEIQILLTPDHMMALMMTLQENGRLSGFPLPAVAIATERTRTDESS